MSTEMNEKKRIIVFTNGIFDVIHSGHIELLKFAKSQGDELIVGVNSDESTKRLKGETRPIFSLMQRINILNALECVDRVVAFHEDTPERLITEIKPDVLVKGPEAFGTEIPGASFVESYGGKVITIPGWDVKESTSLILQKLLKENERPLSEVCEVQINEQPTQLEQLDLMFNRQPDGIRPVLYQNGKRVIDPWSIKLIHNQPKDKNGASS